MDSDVIFEAPKMFGELDSCGDIFMTGGVMDPKELYLNDLSCIKDTKDSTSSSSDSGISNLDDVADFDHVADLTLDSEFKDLDFSLDFDSVIKTESIFDSIHTPSDLSCVVKKEIVTRGVHNVENCFNPDILLDSGVIVKSEPLSPTGSPMGSETESSDQSDHFCGLNQHPISPDFYTLYDDSTTIDPDSPPPPLLLHRSDQYHLLQQLQQQLQTQENNLSIGIPQHQQQPCIIQPSTIQSSSSICLSSPPLSSPSLAKSTSVATIISTPKFGRQQSIAKNMVVSSVHPSNPDIKQVTSPINPRNIVVMPQVKNEVLTLSPSSPSSPLSSSLSSPLSSHPVSAISIIPMTTKPAAAINLNAILSTKKKIQPKPGLDKVSKQGQWLNSSGLSQVPMTSQPIPVAAGSVISSPPLVTASGAITSLTDSKSMKRAQRIIKNRESASLSRKRKKEYLSSLEDRLQACVDENRRLQQENLELKNQLDSLFQVNTQLKNPAGVSPAKKICLMCFTLFLVINISGFSFLKSSFMDMNQRTSGLVYHHAGRQLLSLSTQESENGDVAMMSMSEDDIGKAWLEKTFRKMQDKELLGAKMNWTYANNMCAMAHINSTESIRLAEQLTGWMVQQEEEKKRKKDAKKTGKPNARKKYYPPLRRFNSATATSVERRFHSRMEATTQLNSIHTGRAYHLQLFNGPDQKQQFLNAIPRRNDTFYVLSFSTDYFLVPASAHNKTMRPRMSLLMPVLSSSLNDSMKSGENSVAMMQIDCEILNTNLIHVQRSAFPSETNFNGTSFDKFDNMAPSGNDTDNHNSTSRRDNYWEKLKNARK